MPSILIRSFGFYAVVFCGTVAVTWLLNPPNKLASQVLDSPATHCQAATPRSAREKGVPTDAVNKAARSATSLTDSRPLQTWPWTVSQNETATCFDTADQAAAFVFRHFKAGSQNSMISCFLLNYRDHAQPFSSVEQMFDADQNAKEAAIHLKKLGAQSGDWAQAIKTFRGGSHIPAGSRQRDIGTATPRLETVQTASVRSQPESGSGITPITLTFDESGGQ